MDRGDEVSLLMEGKVRQRRKRWTMVQPLNPMDLYRLIQEQFYAPPRSAHFPGRTQSSTDLLKYYAVLCPLPHPGMAKRFRRHLNRFNPWKSPRLTLREKKRMKAEKSHRSASASHLSGPASLEKQPLEPAAIQEDEEIGFDQVLLTTRILELEQEIQLYKDENERIAEMRQTLEEEQSELEKSKRSFDLIRNKTLEIISEKKDGVRRERERVRRVALELGKALEKKNAEDQSQEIEQLRSKVAELQADLRRRTKRWSSTSQKLKATIEALRGEKGLPGEL